MELFWDCCLLELLWDGSDLLVSFSFSKASCALLSNSACVMNGVCNRRITLIRLWRSVAVSSKNNLILDPKVFSSCSSFGLDSSIWSGLIYFAWWFKRIFRINLRVSIVALWFCCCGCYSCYFGDSPILG